MGSTCLAGLALSCCLSVRQPAPTASLAVPDAFPAVCHVLASPLVKQQLTPFVDPLCVVFVQPDRLMSTIPVKSDRHRSVRRMRKEKQRAAYPSICAGRPLLC
eukprot:758219-Hanusia_phi.AAC.2